MTASLSEMKRLLSVLDIAFRAEQLRMVQINSRINALKDQLNEIERPTAPSNDTIDPAKRAGADLRWQSWVQDRKTLINQELALVMRDKEQARMRMIGALSKREAAKNLKTRMMHEEKRQALSRSSW